MILPVRSIDCGVAARDSRLFLEAVLWIAGAGSPWRDLPEYCGHWHRVYVRYNSWSHKGHSVRVFDAIADDPDLEYLMIDGSIVRVHQHGAAKKTAGSGSHGQTTWWFEHQDSYCGRCIG